MNNLPAGSTIGILGGGQLGRMLSVAASRLGYKTQIYEPAANPPAADVAHAVTTAGYDDIAALQGLGVLGVAALLYFSLLSVGRAEDEVRTMSFALLVLANLMLILTNRSWTLSILATLRQRRNPTVKWIVSAAVIVLVALVQIPVLRELFNLGTITVMDWAVVCAAALVSVLWFEIYKTKKTRALARA